MASSDPDNENMFRDLLEEQYNQSSKVDVVKQKRHNLNMCLKTASDHYLDQDFKSALPLLNEATRMLRKDPYPEEFGLSELDLCAIGYLLARCCIEEGLHMKMVWNNIDSLISTYSETFPALYYAKALMLYRMDDYDNALICVEETLTLLDKLPDLPAVNCPGANQQIAETDKYLLQQVLEDLKQTVTKSWCGDGKSQKYQSQESLYNSGVLDDESNENANTSHSGADLHDQSGENASELRSYIEKLTVNGEQPDTRIVGVQTEKYQERKQTQTEFQTKNKWIQVNLTPPDSSKQKQYDIDELVKKHIGDIKTLITGLPQKESQIILELRNENKNLQLELKKLHQEFDAGKQQSDMRKYDQVLQTTQLRMQLEAVTDALNKQQEQMTEKNASMEMLKVILSEQVMNNLKVQETMINKNRDLCEKMLINFTELFEKASMSNYSYIVDCHKNVEEWQNTLKRTLEQKAQFNKHYSDTIQALRTATYSAIPMIDTGNYDVTLPKDSVHKSMKFMLGLLEYLNQMQSGGNQCYPSHPNVYQNHPMPMRVLGVPPGCIPRPVTGGAYLTSPNFHINTSIHPPPMNSITLPPTTPEIREIVASTASSCSSPQPPPPFTASDNTPAPKQQQSQQTAIVNYSRYATVDERIEKASKWVATQKLTTASSAAAPAAASVYSDSLSIASVQSIEDEIDKLPREVRESGTGFCKLYLHLSRTVPNARDGVLLPAIKKVRVENNGKLSGLTIEEISQRVADVISQM